MPRFFFDTNDGVKFIEDYEGLELDDIEAARDEATRGLADMARDTIPGAIRKELLVQVRDEAQHPLLRATLWFEVAVLVTEPRARGSSA